MGFESNVYLWFNIVLISLHVSIAREASLYRSDCLSFSNFFSYFFSFQWMGSSTCGERTQMDSLALEKVIVEPKFYVR